jgi:hypothetical protein
MTAVMSVDEAKNAAGAASAAGADLRAFDPASIPRIQARLAVARWLVRELEDAVGGGRGLGDYTVSPPAGPILSTQSVDELKVLRARHRTQYAPQTLAVAILDGDVDGDRSLWRVGADRWMRVDEALALPPARYAEIVREASDGIAALQAVASEVDAALSAQDDAQGARQAPRCA